MRKTYAFAVLAFSCFWLDEGVWGQNLILNPSFEDDGAAGHNPPAGWSVWATVGSLNGTLAAGSSPYNPFDILDYEYAAGAIGKLTTYSGGFYQEFDVEPGLRYNASVYIHTPTLGWPPPQARLGVDPDGGADPVSGDILWTDWETDLGNWHRIGFLIEDAVIAAATRMTVFLQASATTPTTMAAALFDYVNVHCGEHADPLPAGNLWGWVSPGTRWGDDRGPSDPAKYANSLYSDANKGYGVRGSWSDVEPAEGVWYWDDLDAEGALHAPQRDAGLVLYLGLGEGFGPPSYPLEVGTSRYWFHAERYMTEMAKRANQWGAFVWRYDNEPEGRGDVSGHGERLRHVYLAMKTAHRNNIVIAPNISGALSSAYSNLYNNYGLKYTTDVIGTHQYSSDPDQGVSGSGIVSMHNILESHGDGAKKMLLTEGWSVWSSLTGIFRPNHFERYTAGEVDIIRNGVINGYRNMTTNEITSGLDPDWVWGALFFTMNDWYNKYGWRDRAVPVDEDEDGEVDYYLVDGYRVGLDIDPSFNPTGLTDFAGNSKDDIMDLYPGAGLSLANPGFELEWSLHDTYGWEEPTDPPDPAVYWVDRSIRHYGRNSLRIQCATASNEYVYQRTVPHSVTTPGAYTVAAWVRADDVVASGRGAALCLRVLDASGAPLGGDMWSSGLVGTNDWTRLEVTATAPSGVDALETYLCMDDASGRAWFDDVSINAGSTTALAAVAGAVVDYNYDPLPGVTVSIEGTASTAVTGATGSYRIEGVVPGTYDMNATKAGYGIAAAHGQIAPASRTRAANFVVQQLDPRLPTDIRVLDPRTGNRINISWRNPTDPTFQYVNIYTTDIPGEPGMLILGGITGESAALEGLMNGERHYLHLRAVHSDIGESDPTEAFLARAGYGSPEVIYRVEGSATWGHSAADFGQTFVSPDDFDLAEVSLIIGTGGTGKRLMHVKIREGGPWGPQIGPTRSANMTSDHYTSFYWGQGEVPLEGGQTYYVHMYTYDGSFAPYRCATNPYPDGMMHQNGLEVSSSDVWASFAASCPPEVGLRNVTSTDFGSGTIGVEWDSDIPATSQVEYGLTEGYGSLSPFDPDRVTRHGAVISGLSLDTEYHFRVKGDWNGVSFEESPDYTFVPSSSSPPLPTWTPTPTETPDTRTPTPTPTPTPAPSWGTELLRNPGFEEDGVSFVRPPAGWQYFQINEAADGTLQCYDWGLEFWPYEGTFVAGKITYYGTPHHGFYQAVRVAPGGEYECSVYVYAYVSYPGTGGEARLGADPDGGVNPFSPSVLWTEWIQPEDGWVQIGFAGHEAVEPTNDYLTLFLELRQNQVAPWNGVFFDLASVHVDGLIPDLIPVTGVDHWMLFR